MNPFELKTVDFTARGRLIGHFPFLDRLEQPVMVVGEQR